VCFKYTPKIHTKNGWLKWLVKNGYTPKLVDTPKKILFGWPTHLIFYIRVLNILIRVLKNLKIITMIYQNWPLYKSLISRN
jgi:hypothetical protein